MRDELDKVISALCDFYGRETHLLQNDLGERTLTHRLAVALESQFPQWSVDCDYNRLGERIWRLPKASIVSTDDELGKSIYPDIVVHHRGVPENLLAIEVRKASNHQAPAHDRHKLRGLTDPHLWFAFRIGVLLNLGRTGIIACEVYVGGEPDLALSEWLACRLKQQGLAPARVR
jgi:hypothetical protein